MVVRLAIPDLISNSYFPAIAAVELGLFRAEGVDASLDLVFPVTRTMQELHAGHLDYVAGAAHATLAAFPEWEGAKLLCALAQHTYWFLVVRADLHARRGDVAVVRGLRIGAARAFTFPALVTTDRRIQERPDEAGAAVHAIVRAQQMLREDPERATEIGRRVFPPMEAELVADLIRRDLPCYDPSITPEGVRALNQFALAADLLARPRAYEAVVATQFAPLWSAA